MHCQYIFRIGVYDLIGFASVLKFLRKKAGMTAEEVADILGVKKRTIFAYEKNDVKPSYENLLKLADYFNVTLDFLVGRSKIYAEPEGKVSYAIKGVRKLYVGDIDYVFGALMVGQYPRQFMLITEKEKGLIYDAIDSRGSFLFLSLVYLLHQNTGIEYDAFQNNRVDLLIKQHNTYYEIAIDRAESPMPHALSYDEEIVKEWVAKPNKEKKEILEQYYYLCGMDKC
ncbi:helix-turn-helix domain-containing protein [uncultured Acidaminococcus sp.]|uniref:helix-turn-helix domain-containing protein n=1 Tax=uncultured Acidaminococcus sp. TaxID=352152 RepID=UPI0025938A3F|nr:helix-turn-helix transcriptional regulator [uncultured Acidaminococcus sp.]